MGEAKVYRLSPGGWRRPLVQRSALLIVLFAGMGWAFVQFDSDGMKDPMRVGLYAAILGCVCLFVLVSLARKMRSEWNSYRLIVDENHIRRDVRTAQTLELLAAEVTKVSRLGDNGLRIDSARAARMIFVPSTLEGYESVFEHLRGWGKPIEFVPVRGVARFVSLALSTVVAALVVVATLLGTDVRVVLPCGLLVLILIGISGWQMRKLALTTGAYKRTRWLLIPAALGVILKCVSVARFAWAGR